MKSLKVAVQGCCHGELDAVYSKLKDVSVDLLIITGDFQAIRNITDLNTMAVPQKYKQLGQFHKYYSKQKRVPIPTIFIGGNHECSSYLKELKYGGWVAPNIYYLGEFGSIWYRGLRISGVSGIYNEQSFIRNHNVVNDPKLPYDQSTIRSVYHISSKNYLKLMLMKSNSPIEVMVSHDWPQYIYHHGNLRQLLKNKPFFKEDVESGRLGNPLLRHALNHLTPDYWFSSHLHVKFEASVKGGLKPPGNEEIDLDMDMDGPIETNTTETKFLALDKCGRVRKHLQVMEIPVDRNHVSYDNKDFYYDVRAIAINKVMEEYVRSAKWSDINPKTLIGSPPDLTDIDRLVEAETETFNKDPDFLLIPDTFKALAPAGQKKPPLQYYPNNQTEDYCNKYRILS